MPPRSYGDARSGRPQPRAHRAVKAGARGTAGSAVAPPTRRQPLANAPALAGLARGLMGACQPTHLEEDLRRTRIDEQKVEKRAHDAVTLGDA